MPKRTRDNKPADLGSGVVKPDDVETSEQPEQLKLDRVKRVAAELGSRGGKARAARMTPE